MSAAYRLWFIPFLLVTSWSGPLMADELPRDSTSDVQLLDLKKRIERLEMQNTQLLRQLGSRPLTADEVEPEPVSADGDTWLGNDDETATSDSPMRLIQNTVPMEDEPKPKPTKGAAVPDWYESGSDNTMSASWRNGLEIETKNRDFRVHVGGRTQFDSSWFNTDAAFQSDPSIVNPVRDGVDFRRARFRIDGTMYEQIDWAAEYDFVNSSLTLPSATGNPTATNVPAPTDLYWTFTKIPVLGNIRVGNQKEYIGFEHLRSSRFLPFMERSFNQDAFYGAFNNGFTPGVNVFNSVFEERGTWAIGFFKPSSNVFAYNNTPGDYSVTGRASFLPWYVDEGRGLIHVGISGRTAGMTDGFARYRTRGPERSGTSQTWPLFADTGRIQGNGQQMLNLEFTANFGSLTVTSEYLSNWVQGAFVGSSAPVGTVFYNGGYVEALYFLTGEHQEYNPKVGWYERVVPRENAFYLPGSQGPLFGRGAWQLGLRYNYLNLNDKGINGGRLNDITLGLNWFLNPNMKIQANYSITDRTSPRADHDGWNQGVGIRVAHDF